MQFLHVGKIEAESVQEQLHTLEALQNEIKAVIRNVTEGELQQVSQNF